MDKRKKIEIIITGALVLVFIMLLFSLLMKIHPRRKEAPFAGEEKQRVTSPTPGRRDLPKDIPWGRDPFVLEKPDAVKGKKQHLSLGAVVWDAENPYALINNEVVKPGQVCKGCRVVEINKDNVVLEKDGRIFTLRLYEQ